MGQSPSALIDTIQGNPSQDGTFAEELKEALPNLLQAGVNINYVDVEGKTALHWAATQGQEEIIKLLLSFGADPQIKDDQGYNALTAAVFMGHASCVSAFLDKGTTDIDATNKDGMTPLHWVLSCSLFQRIYGSPSNIKAVLQKHTDCVELLIRGGASVTLKNSKGQTPLTITSSLRGKARQQMNDFLEYCLQTHSSGSSPSTLPNTPTKMNGSSRPRETPSLRSRRLVALCKAWGIVKFIHPFFLHSEIDWDSALLNAISSVNAAVTADDYRQSLSKLLATLGDPNTRVLEPTSNESILSNDQSSQAQPYVTRTADQVAVFIATHHEQFSDYRAMMQFSSVIRDLLRRDPSGIIFDLRLKRGQNLSVGNHPFKFMFYESFRHLLDREIPLSSFRQRMFSGFPQERDFGNIFHSGVQSSAGNVVLPADDFEESDSQRSGKPAPRPPRPWLFLINRGTPESIIDLVSGLQTAGLAKVVLEEVRGEGSQESQESSPELGISTFLINAGEGVTVAIRKNERVNADGSLGFVPNLVVPVGKETTSDVAMLAALEVMRGSRKLPHVKLKVANVYIRKHNESEHETSQFPTKEQRILGLFRLWNTVRYFFPYRDLMDEDWDSVLLEFLPRMENAKNELEYSGAVAEMTSRLSDSHASVNSAALNSFFGASIPPLEVRSIENKTIVTHLFATPQSEISQLSPGDEIVAIDGEKIQVRRNRLAKFLSASTPQALQLKIHQKLLAGAKDSSVKLQVEGKGGKSKTVTLVRDLPATTSKGPSRPPYSVLPEGFGFIDTVNLKQSDVDRALEVIKDTPALILDIRGYPKGTIYNLAPRLIDSKVKVATTETPLLLPSMLYAEMESARIAEDHFVQPSAQWKYKGKIVALVNEETISHAEHSCLYLKACANVTFVGSPTNGTNGNVTNLSLPGGILVGFTGLKAVHPTGEQLQRKGIQPHLKALPTVEGVRHSVDEAFLNAVSLLKRQFPADDSKAPKQKEADDAKGVFPKGG